MMIKLVYALHPSLEYLVRAQIYAFRHKTFPKTLRNEYLKGWSDKTLDRMNVKLSVKGKPTSKPCLFVGNHLSYLDIPLLCGQVPALFLAKKELSRWPVIGNAAKFVGTVFVDRDSQDSRKLSAQKVVEKLAKDKERVVIFPSGTTSVDENVPWRLGAFRIAVENKIPVQAFRIRYSPESSAFVGDDNFLPHMYRLLKNPEIKASIEFQTPKLISDASKDMEKIKAWCMR